MSERAPAVGRSLPVLAQADLRGIDDLPAVTRSLRILGQDCRSGIKDLQGLRNADLRYLVDLVETTHRAAAAGHVDSRTALCDEPSGIACRGDARCLRAPVISALLARRCAVPDARRALVIGTGVQAQLAIPFLLTTLPDLDRLMVFGADSLAIAAMRSHLRTHFSGKKITVVHDLRVAAGEAQVIVAAAGPDARCDVEAGWLHPGALSILVEHGLARSTLHRADRVYASSDARMRRTGRDLADGDGRIPTPDAEFPALISGRSPGRRSAHERIFAYNA